MIRNRCFGSRGRHLGFTLLCGVLVLAACRGQAQERKQEADKLAALLNWQPGSVVAEIGAGDGSMTLAAAERAGPTGRVYTTELDPDKLAKLQSLAAEQKNIIAVKAGEAETNLPHECCDSVFLRRVYHHFTGPERGRQHLPIAQAGRPSRGHRLSAERGARRSQAAQGRTK